MQGDAATVNFFKKLSHYLMQITKNVGG